MFALPLGTRSLVLRRFVAEDAALLLALNAEPSTSRWLPSHVYADREAADAALAHLIAAYAAPGDPRLGPYVLGIDDARTGRLIGHVGFSPLDGEVEVSYAVAEALRGRGYGSEALDAACAWVCRTFGLPGVVAVTASDNIASRRLLERVRFIHEKDESRRFQGVQQAVAWYRRAAPDRPAPVTIVPFEPTHTEDLVRMWHASFEHGVGIVDPHPIESRRAYFLREVVPGTTVRVAQSGGAVVGFMASTPESIAHLYVKVEHIGQGIGTQLLALAKQSSAGSLGLFAFSRNHQACRFYQRHGFVEVGRESENMYRIEAIQYLWRRAGRPP